MTKTMRPYDVTDTEQFLQMDSDNLATNPDKWSILHNGDHVSLHAPGGGKWVTIPRDQFNAMVDWYLKPQKVSEPSHG